LSAFCPGSCSCGNQGGAADLFCPLPREDGTRCGKAVVTNASVLSCGHPFPREHDPNGVYTCVKSGYNSKNLYTRKDDAGITWSIRFETREHLDWGAFFLGQNVGSGSMAKWVLQSQQLGEVGSPHYFLVEGEHRVLTVGTSVPRSTAWVPRTAANTDLDCAGNGMVTPEYGPLEVDYLCLSYGFCEGSDSRTISMFACNDDPCQNWRWEGTMLKPILAGDKCLTSAGDDKTVVITPCGESWPNQSWYSSASQIKTAYNDKCLELYWRISWWGRNEAIRVRKCEAGNVKQQWYF